MTADIIDYEALDTLLDELDAEANIRYTSKLSDGRWVSRRNFPRHPFRVDCKVRFFPTDSFKMMELQGRTRNLTRSGIGMLVRRFFAMAEPIEVEVLVPGRSKMYMAGLVRYCRYVSRKYHELGVELKTVGEAPIFSDDQDETQEMLEWLRGDYPSFSPTPI